MPRRHEERRRARQIAVQLLYEEDVVGDSFDDSKENESVVFDENPVPDYASKLVDDFSSHREHVDDLISASSKNWSLDRMPMVDRAIMRMATSEMLYEDSVPVSVSINEAVELAKQFGGEDESPQFTNGILGNIARNQEANEDEQGNEADVDRSDDAQDIADESGAEQDAASDGDDPQDAEAQTGDQDA